MQGWRTSPTTSDLQWQASALARGRTGGVVVRYAGRAGARMRRSFVALVVLLLPLANVPAQQPLVQVDGYRVVASYPHDA